MDTVLPASHYREAVKKFKSFLRKLRECCPSEIVNQMGLTSIGSLDEIREGDSVFNISRQDSEIIHFRGDIHLPQNSPINENGEKILIIKPNISFKIEYSSSDLILHPGPCQVRLSEKYLKKSVCPYYKL